MVPQITGVSIVCSIVGSGADQRKHLSSASLAFVTVTGEFPAQKANDAENVSIWCHNVNLIHGFVCFGWNFKSTQI